MKTLILTGSIILIIVSLSIFMYQFMKAESNKERAVMTFHRTVRYVVQPVLLGFIYAVVFM